MKYEIVNDPARLAIKCPTSLTKKIHLPERGNCKYLFAIGKLGESTWRKTLSKLKFRDFTFFDPYNRESPIEYNSLFDPHLQEYFYRTNIKTHLLKSHLITDNNEIVCSIREFNEYRRCMHRLKTECAFDKQRRDSGATSGVQNNALCESRSVAGIGKKSLNPLNYENVLTKMRNRKFDMEEAKRRRDFETIQKYKSQVKKISKLQELKKSQIRERGLHRKVEITKKQIYVLEQLRLRRAYIKHKMRRHEKRKGAESDTKRDPISYIIRCPVKI